MSINAALKIKESKLFYLCAYFKTANLSIWIQTMKNREKINSQTNLSSHSDSPIEKLEFKGRQIIDKTGPFLVQLKLNENERLEIHIENTVTFDNYSCVVRNEDMKRENTRSGNSFIETGSELFQIVEISLA